MNKPKYEDLIRKEIYSIDEVREKTKDVLFEKDKRNAKVDFDRDLIKGNSQRYQTFFTKGCKCVVCGIEGKYFAKERHLYDKTYHLNLYAVDDNGDEILMTKDHIIPRSKGGIDDISCILEELKSPVFVGSKDALNNLKVENEPMQKQRRVLLFENENLDLEQRGNKYYLSLYDTIGRFKKEVTIDMKDDILEILSREDCYGNI